VHCAGPLPPNVAQCSPLLARETGHIKG
jgi:hypothetical protein